MNPSPDDGPLNSDFGTNALIEHWRRHRDDATRIAVHVASGTTRPLVIAAADLALQGLEPSTQLYQYRNSSSVHSSKSVSALPTVI
jgi:hypothetical protein